MVNIQQIAFSIDHPQALAETHHCIKVGPVGKNGNLSHRLLLPIDWVSVPIDENLTIDLEHIEPLSLFLDAKQEEFPKLEVGVTQWPWDVELEDFLRYTTSRLGFEPVRVRSVELKGLQVIDGVFALREEKGTLAARVMVFKNHDLLFRVMGAGESDDFELGLGKTFDIAIESFSLEQPTQSEYLGKTETYQMPFGFSMIRPEPWRPMPQDMVTPGLQVVDFRLLGERDVYAYHRVKFMDADHFSSSAAELKSKTIEEWAEAGFVEEGEAEQSALETALGKGRSFLIKGRLHTNPVVLWLSVLRAFTGTLAVSTMAPQKSQQALVWMAAKRMHGLSVKTLKMTPN